MNWRKSKPVLKKPTYNFYNYQTTIGVGTNNSKWKLIASSFTAAYTHISAVQNGRRVYLQTLLNTAYQWLHEIGIPSLGGSPIVSEASPNSTISSSINLIESTTMDGHCFGGQYSDPYGTCDSVVVQPIKIISKNFVVPIERTSSQLILRLGQRCESRRECLDSENGQIFWSVVSQNSCQFDRYDVLYEGTAIKSRRNHVNC